MKKIALSLFVISFFCSAVVAQAPRGGTSGELDIVGTWILDRKASTSDAVPREYENYVMTISQSDSEVRIRKSYDFRKKRLSYDTILYVDGRGERNVFPSAISKRTTEIKSKTVLRKGTIQTKFEYDTGIGQLVVSVTEEYRLSKDGEKLIIDSRSSSQMPLPRAAERHRVVFRRESIQPDAPSAASSDNQ